jgi:superfamily I DNA/RNA helicase
MSWELALGWSFQEAVARLAPARQAAVQETLLKLQKGNASVHVHALESLPFVGIAVTRDAMRIVATRDADTLLLLHVDTHDDAYEWARRHRALRIGRVIRVVRTEEASVLAPVEAGTTAPGPLASLPDKVFRRFGLDPAAARGFRAIPDEDALLGLAALVAPPLGEALLGLAADPDEEPALLAAFEASASAPPVSLSEAVRDPVNAAGIWVPPPGEEALSAALRGDLASWRVFLHPSQLRLVRMRANGPVKVTGGPGTGKTVVAMHRARWLAEAGGAVLITAFSRALVDAITPSLTSLCADDPAILARIDVRTTLDVSREVLRRAGRPSAFLDGEVVDACWEDAMARDTLDLPLTFYRTERDGVLARNGAWTEEDYLRARRRDSGRPLDRARRRAVWPVLAGFEDALAARGGGDATALARRATDALDAGATSPWSAVVCDEVQDSGPAELRLFAALTKGSANGLFLCGDGHQRLFRTPVSLASCGIDVVGRSRRLRLNYRTTEGIRRAAVALVAGQPIDTEESGAMEGYRSVRAGPPPVERTFTTPAEEAAWIAEEAAHGLLVLARTRSYLDQLRALLAARGIDARLLSDDEDLGAISGVVLCTLHRSKGLEAPRVILAGMQLVPARWPGEAEGDREAWAHRERSLLYVGTTRARDWCGWSRVV